MSLWPFNRRNPFTASRMAAAVHRSTICPPRHRLTFRFTWRVRLIKTLDGVGRRERLTEAIGEAEREDGERLLEPFAHTGRRTRITILEPARQILQQPSGRRDV